MKRDSVAIDDNSYARSERAWLSIPQPNTRLYVRMIDVRPVDDIVSALYQHSSELSPQLAHKQDWIDGTVANSVFADHSSHLNSNLNSSDIKTYLNGNELSLITVPSLVLISY